MGLTLNCQSPGRSGRVGIPATTTPTMARPFLSPALALAVVAVRVVVATVVVVERARRLALVVVVARLLHQLVVSKLLPLLVVSKAHPLPAARRALALLAEQRLVVVIPLPLIPPPLRRLPPQALPLRPRGDVAPRLGRRLLRRVLRLLHQQRAMEAFPLLGIRGWLRALPHLGLMKARCGSLGLVLGGFLCLFFHFQIDCVSFVACCSPAFCVLFFPSIVLIILMIF